MPRKSLSIVSVSAEIAPFSKTGGLGEVARALPRALRDRGHNVAAVAPLHRTTIRAFPDLLHVGTAQVPLDRRGKTILKATFYRGNLDRIPVYFIDHPRFFSDHRTVYESPFTNERFYFFNRAVLALLRHLGVVPDVIQCHDWHTGLLPHFASVADDGFARSATVFTIHNLVFQMGRDWWTVPPKERDDGFLAPETLYENGRVERINFALRGIRSADAVSTVSENYRREILTKEFGENLEEALRARKRDLFGIVNGIDYETYNPATDPGLPVPYDVETVERKEGSKRALQELCQLPQRNDVALLGMVSRISEQKGFDLLLEILDVLMKLKVQIVIMGSGDQRYERAFRAARRRHRDRFSYLAFDQKRETLVYAGSDLFLMPSRFEPCGLGQLISLRYGSIPVIHAVGGLQDTVTDFNPRTGRGNGFVFKRYDARLFLSAIVRGVENWMHNEEPWQRLVRRSMRQVFSWEIPARRYTALFHHAIRRRQLRAVFDGSRSAQTAVARAENPQP